MSELEGSLRVVATVLLRCPGLGLFGKDPVRSDNDLRRDSADYRGELQRLGRRRHRFVSQYNADVLDDGYKFRYGGKSFQDVSEVRFGSHKAIFEVVSNGEILAISPQGSGRVAVFVTTPGGTSAKTKSGRFTYMPKAK